MQLTHAIYFKDNRDGEGDKYWLLAAFVDDVFYTDEGAPVIKHEGDEVLKAVALDDTDAMAAIEAAKVEARKQIANDFLEFASKAQERCVDMTSSAESAMVEYMYLLATKD